MPILEAIFNLLLTRRQLPGPRVPKSKPSLAGLTNEVLYILHKPMVILQRRSGEGRRGTNQVMPIQFKAVVILSLYVCVRGRRGCAAQIKSYIPSIHLQTL